jgi:hydrogenase maturation protease
MKPRILVAGIGNIFLGDDAFGVEVAQKLLRMSWPEHVRVADYGIRGFDLTYALIDGYDAAILVDAVPRGEAPGTLYVIEPDLNEMGTPGSGNVLPETHGMNPMQVLAMVRALTDQTMTNETTDQAPKRVLILGCEPSPCGEEEEQERMGLSEPVKAAVDEAVRMVSSLVDRITTEHQAIAVLEGDRI